MKLLTAALAATMIGTAAMADTVQILKPDGKTETFRGVEADIDGKTVVLKNADGNEIVTLVNVQMIIRPEDKDKDEPDGPSTPDTGFRGFETINSFEYQFKRRVRDYFAGAGADVDLGQTEISKDEPDGPALPPKRRPFPDVTVSPGFSQNFTGGKINLAGGATRGTFNVEENTSFEEDDQ